MPNIFYYADTDGRLRANWPGISKRVPVTHEDGTVTSEPRKQGQMRLGLVVDKDNLLFFKEEEGFFTFNPEDQTCTEIPPDLLPSWLEERTLRHKRPPVIVDFGGSYFLDELIKGINYNTVLDKIKYQNRDRLYTMLQYYILSDQAANMAEEWYQHNFTKFLYPCANPASARISELLAAIGSEENRRDFLLEHIKYLLKSTDEELCILVDSTGMPNKCNLEYTRVSAHEGEVNIEFRVIVVVQKSTGLPVYYEMIPGNVVDVSTIDMITRKLLALGYKVEYSLGDSAYSCPAVLERLALSGIDFMTRLNPTYETYKSVVEKNLDNLEKFGKNILFHNRTVKILKIPTVIAIDKDGKEITGFVYLCRDINSWHGKSNHFLNSKKAKAYTSEEREAECNRFGLFALVSTIELSEEEVLKEYYMRQAIEQFFDYAKNYAKFLPVRCRTVNTVKGHLLLGFIATFILVLIKNRLNILDSPYARIPLTLKDELMEEDQCITIDHGDGTDIEILISQEPLMNIFKGCPASLFSELQFQKADVYERELVPSVPTAIANDFYKAYHMTSPLTVLWNPETNELSYLYKDGVGNHCTRRIAFARRPVSTNETIQTRRDVKEAKKNALVLAEFGFILDENGKVVEAPATATAPLESPKEETPHRGRGRPPGSKNKKTLEREAEQARLEAEGKAPKKRGRGRPPGSKNKKTLEREAEQARLAAERKAAKRKGRRSTKDSKK